MNSMDNNGNIIETNGAQPESEPKILVSVVVPIYNAYDYLEAALDSILDQTLREIEVICIDDGSTDRSIEIIKRYHEKDKRIRVVTENNAGVSTARNKGIARVRGEYTIFLDADDFYEPMLLEHLYKAAVEGNLDIAIAKYDIYNSKTGKFSSAIDETHGDIYLRGAVVSKNEYPNHIFESTTGYVWNKLFKTAMIKAKELTFAPELYIFEDVYFVCAALSFADRVARLDEVLIHHRVYSDQARAKLFRKYYNNVPEVYLKIKEFLMHNGMYIPLSLSYLNLSASRCYKVYNLLTGDAKRDFWNLLHTGKAEAMSWYKHDSADFESNEVYDFVANVGLYSFEQYEKRKKRGKELDTENLPTDTLNKKIKKAKRKEKISDASHTLFGKFKRKKD
ncbi:MAG: glycosyltransferase family 2 protein [Clostridia bacterium]|nr:glycosyltransferase family 2 protein [Clostridia bacterium]